MSTELIIELPKANALQIFTEPDGVVPYIDKIRKEVLSLIPDITTKKGRDEIASMAFRVSKSKTYLENAGKSLCDAERSKIDITLKAVLASRKYIEKELDAIRDEVRKPLTDWENAEADRKRKIETRIESMQQLPEIGSDSIAIQKHLTRLEKTEIDESFGEYTAEAALARTRAMRECKAKLEAQIKIENDLRELELLREQQLDMAQKEREKALIDKAINDVKIAAEKEASNIKIEAAIAAAIIEAEVNEKIAAVQAEIEAERAAIRKTERLEELEIAEENRLKNDEDHRKKIHDEVLESLKENGFNKSESERFLTAVINNKIKHITAFF